MEENKTVEMMTQNQFVDQVIETYRSKRNRFCFILGAGASARHRGRFCVSSSRLRVEGLSTH